MPGTPNTVVRSTSGRMGVRREELTSHALYKWHQSVTREEDDLFVWLSVSKESTLWLQS